MEKTQTKEYNTRLESDILILQTEINRWSEEQKHPIYYHVRTFGCQQNESDSEKIRGLLEESGLQPASDYSQADLVLINTCSIRENADQRLFGHLGELKTLRSAKPSLLIGVCGCLPTQPVQRQKIRESYPFVHLLFGPSDIGRLPQLLTDLLKGKKHVEAVSETAGICEDLPTIRERRDRALCSIMYGCNNFCTYCVVPHTRGREKSRSATSILWEAWLIAQNDIPEIMLLGQNVNAWGFDLFPKQKRDFHDLIPSESDTEALKAIRQQISVEIHQKAQSGNQDQWSQWIDSMQLTNLGRLMAAISGIPGIQRIRYMSPHPRDVDKDFIAALAVIPEVENHIHLPLQSGSNAILKAMNRHYDREQFETVVTQIRKVRPEIALTTDIIVAFPGETEEDFQETLDLVEKLRFEKAFTFIYSPRPGTPAAQRIEDFIPSEQAHHRFDRLTLVLNQLSLEAHQALLHTLRPVIIEGVSRNDITTVACRDSEFHLINVPIPVDTDPEMGGISAGQQRMVKITEAKTFSLEGVLI